MYGDIEIRQVYVTPLVKEDVIGLEVPVDQKVMRSAVCLSGQEHILAKPTYGRFSCYGDNRWPMRFHLYRNGPLLPTTALVVRGGLTERHFKSASIYG